MLLPIFTHSMRGTGRKSVQYNSASNHEARTPKLGRVALMPTICILPKPGLVVFVCLEVVKRKLKLVTSEATLVQNSIQRK